MLKQDNFPKVSLNNCFHENVIRTQKRGGSKGVIADRVIEVLLCFAFEDIALLSKFSYLLIQKYSLRKHAYSNI